MKKIKTGKRLKSGDVVLINAQFVDSDQFKKRPTVVLFEELGNIVVAGITSNTKMKGISLSVNEGAVKDSVIKLNYIFTIPGFLIEKKLFSVSSSKFDEVREGLNLRLTS